MKRNRRREFVMTQEEFEDLETKAAAACMSQSQLIRLLIAGYNPPPAPDERFFEQMDELLKVSGRLAAAAKIIGDKGSEALAKQLREEATKIRMLRRNLEEKYLSGERSDHKWQ